MTRPALKNKSRVKCLNKDIRDLGIDRIKIRYLNSYI